MRIQYDEGPDGLAIVPAGIVAERGVPVQVPDDVAGRAPGAWEQLPASARPDFDDGRQYAWDGTSWSVRDPGAGLLAQSDVWHETPEG